MRFDPEQYAKSFSTFVREGRIRQSGQAFKIRLFMDKADGSIMIARHHKEIVPGHDDPPKTHWQYWAITISYYSMLYAAKAAILGRGYEVKDHTAAQIALGHLLVPDRIEAEDLALLDQAHRIFEEEYVTYFNDARKESHTARYAAIKAYTDRRVDEIFSHARLFLQKIHAILA